MLFILDPPDLNLITHPKAFFYPELDVYLIDTAVV